MGDWVLAIDFGTTTTSAATLVDGRAELVEIDGSPRMPSVVLAADSGELVVGAAAESQLALAPERAERTPKRRLGDEVMLLGFRPVRPVEAVAAILSAVAAEAIRRQGGEAPGELRLTHPAQWGSVRRAKLAEAASLAGLPEPVFVPEPVAAAVHFADERIVPGAYVAVYDLGGGTFDTAVLRRADDGFDVVGLPGGDERLGGETFDDALFAHVGRRIAAAAPDAWEALRFSTERSWRKAGHDLRLEVRKAKEALSANAEYTIYIGAPVDDTVLVTRDELEALIADDVAATVDELDATIARAGLTIADLAAINLVGGSSRIPLVTRLVAERSGALPQTWGDPKAAVALGAVKATRLTALPSGSSGGGTSSTRTATPLPTHVGGHEVVAELGRGGMGVVYLARQSSVGRLVAVKTLPLLDPSLADRLEREAAVLAELQHPHIATVIDVGADERGTHVVMPYFPGGTVAHIVSKGGAMAPGAAVAVVAAVAEALSATHSRGFLHRDVKPSNILLSQAGDPYLADFGLALPLLDSSRLTNSRAVLGTAPYTAPEILADAHPSPAADTYALGVTAYQALTGELPYAGGNVMAVLDAIRRAEPTSITQLNPDVPPALADAVMAAFAPDPAARPADLQAWGAYLRSTVEREPVEPAPPATWAAAALGAASLPITAAATDDEPPTVGDDDTIAQPEVPDDVAALVGFQPSDQRDEDIAVAPVPLAARRARHLDRRVLGGAAAAFVLVVAALGFLLTRTGDDAEPISAEDTTTTTSEAEEGTTTTKAAPAMVTLPQLVGKPAAEAKAALEKLGLKVTIVEEETTNAPAGTVMEMNPDGGLKVKPGDPVGLIIAKAPPPTTTTTAAPPPPPPPSGPIGGNPNPPTATTAPKAPTGSEPPPPTTPPSATPYEQLLALIPSHIQPGCSQLNDGADHTGEQVEAKCTYAGVTLWYQRYQTTSQARTAWEHQDPGVANQGGEWGCNGSTSHYWEGSYTQNGATDGLLRCYVRWNSDYTVAQSSWMHWTDDSNRVFAQATKSGGDWKGLFAVWNDAGPLG